MAAAVCTLVGAPAARANTATFTPVADAYVSSAATGANYGGATSLKLNASPIEHAYLRFDVQLPAGSTINGATFRSWTSSIAPSVGYEAHAVSDVSWSETTITYGNAPAWGAEIGRSAPWSTSNVYVPITLPAGYIHAGLNSVGITTVSTYEKVFASREAANKPQLVVDYTPSGGSTPTATPTPTPTPTPSPTPSPTSDPSLVFEDEFLGPAGSPPDTTVWTAKTEVRGGELQCYTARPQNVQQDGLSHLEIIARHEPGNTFCGSSNARDWTSGRIDTRGKRTWQYGRIEARIKLPNAIGSWPAFWGVGYPGSWPSAGEIDTLEYPQPDASHQFQAHQAAHADSTTSASTSCDWSGHDALSASPWYGDWHVYGFVWRQDHIDFQIDGQTTWTVTPATMPAGCKWEFNRPFGLLLNMAVGGWGGKPDPTRYPATMLVDWVRVYQVTSSTSPSPTPTPTPTASATPTPTPTPTASGSDPVVTAAGDFFSGTSDPDAAAVAQAMKAQSPAVILGLGDYQYSYGSLSALLAGFDKTFGPKPDGLWPLIRPTAGPTHDVSSGTDTANYKSYWGRDPFKPYSFDLGNWHIVQLPSAAYRYSVDTAGVLSWLNSDLAANTKPCTLAFWHEPYWTRPTSTHTRTTAVKPWVQALYDHGAELILSGHQHDYQRFAPQTPNDVRDDANGIREFVVGTGGNGHYGFTGDAANVEVSDASTYGALKLRLHPDGYDWQFLPVEGGAFTDSGHGSCH